MFLMTPPSMGCKILVVLSGKNTSLMFVRILLNQDAQSNYQQVAIFVGVASQH